MTTSSNSDVTWICSKRIYIISTLFKAILQFMQFTHLYHYCNKVLAGLNNSSILSLFTDKLSQVDFLWTCLQSVFFNLGSILATT